MIDTKKFLANVMRWKVGLALLGAGAVAAASASAGTSARTRRRCFPVSLLGAIPRSARRTSATDAPATHSIVK